MIVFSYDGTFAGLLCCVFESFETRIVPDLLETTLAQRNMYAKERIEIITDKVKTERVLLGLEKKLTKFSTQEVSWVYYSEEPNADLILFKFFYYLFKQKRGADENLSEPSVFSVKRLSRKVFREIHRMHAFLRFSPTEEGFWVALIEPECNVLSLIVDHFAARYADQPWVIADKTRQLAMCYTGEQVVPVKVDGKFWKSLKTISQEENQYSSLWQTYFSAVNISERSNDRLQRKHIPAKYRRLMPEFKS